jgi:hypothetical protein
MGEAHDLIDAYLFDPEKGRRDQLFGSRASIFAPPDVEIIEEAWPEARHEGRPRNRFTTRQPFILYPTPSHWRDDQSHPADDRSRFEQLSPKVRNSLRSEEIDSVSTWQPSPHSQPRSDIDDRDLEAQGWRWRDDTQTLLEDLVKLAVEEFTESCYESIAGFVKKWGPLWVCRNASHGECYLPRLHLRPWDTNPCTWAPMEEVKEFWRLAWELKAVLEINAALQKERAASRKLLQHLRLFKTTDLPLDPSGLKIALLMTVQSHLDRPGSGLNVVMQWSPDDPRPTLELRNRLGFLHVAWTQVAQALCHVHGFPQCTACKRFYVRAKRLQRNRANYCEACGRRAAKRDWARRHSRNK